MMLERVNPKPRIVPFPPMMKKREIERDWKYYRRWRTSKWWIKSRKRFATVQLGHVPGKWWLVYEGELNTGPFKTKRRAIDWFMRNGR